MTAPTVYLAHPISQPLAIGGATWRRHQERVRAMAESIARAGWAPVVPIMFRELSHREALRLDHSLVEMCDALIVFDVDSEWTKASTGVQRERRWAREMGKPIVDSVQQLRALRDRVA